MKAKEKGMAVEVNEKRVVGDCKSKLLGQN